MKKIYKKDFVELWLESESSDLVKIGIEKKTIDALKGINFIMMSKSKADHVNKDELIATIETEKMVVRFESPLSGTIEDINQQAIQNPKVLETQWLIKLKLDNPKDLELI